MYGYHAQISAEKQHLILLTTLNHAKSGGFSATGHGRNTALANGGCPDVRQFQMEADAMHKKWRTYAGCIQWERCRQALEVHAFEITPGI